MAGALGLPIDYELPPQIKGRQQVGLIRMSHPYTSLPDRCFWSRATSANYQAPLFGGVPGIEKAKIATAGSCFAQHIGRALRSRGANFMDCEPAPQLFSKSFADRFGYGLYSCRYGNIYTARQLHQLFQEAFGKRLPVEPMWTKDGRFYDPMRPGIEPRGFSSEQEAAVLRSHHLAAVRRMFRELDIFVFTLGLTEAWRSSVDHSVFPIAPGVIAGQYDANRYEFVNFRYNDVYQDLRDFIIDLRQENPTASLILTVSPVPLAATATDEHVLCATTYSKSVLRSAAGDIAADMLGVVYFPSYELITGQPSKHKYYNSDLRTVTDEGVSAVMEHFFNGAPAKTSTLDVTKSTIYGFEHCEESLLDSR